MYKRYLRSLTLSKRTSKKKGMNRNEIHCVDVIILEDDGMIYGVEIEN